MIGWRAIRNFPLSNAARSRGQRALPARIRRAFTRRCAASKPGNGTRAALLDRLSQHARNVLRALGLAFVLALAALALALAALWLFVLLQFGNLP